MVAGEIPSVYNFTTWLGDHYYTFKYPDDKHDSLIRACTVLGGVSLAELQSAYVPGTPIKTRERVGSRVTGIFAEVVGKAMIDFCLNDTRYAASPDWKVQLSTKAEDEQGVDIWIANGTPATCGLDIKSGKKGPPSMLYNFYGTIAKIYFPLPNKLMGLADLVKLITDSPEATPAIFVDQQLHLPDSQLIKGVRFLYNQACNLQEAGFYRRRKIASGVLPLPQGADTAPIFAQLDHLEKFVQTMMENIENYFAGNGHPLVVEP